MRRRVVVPLVTVAVLLLVGLLPSSGANFTDNAPNGGSSVSAADCLSPGTWSAVVFHDHVIFSETPDTRPGLLIDEVQNNATGEHWTLTQWETPPALPFGCTVRSATITLQPSELSPPSPQPVAVYPLTSAYVHATTVWNDRPTYTTVGGDVQDFATVGVDVVYDVTSVVQGWLDGDPNHGFVVKLPDGVTADVQRFPGKDQLPQEPFMTVTW